STLVRALYNCDLSHLTDQLDKTLDWARSLSGGEKQRLAMARVLLSRPDWLFMDEATSAMDTLAERDMLEMLAKELPETTLVSIAHRKKAGQSAQMEIHLDHAHKSLETVIY
ncbi:MAG: ATP-binding cassette domain-containing protein, partial [Pseudomonadota bacterium]